MAVTIQRATKVLLATFCVLFAGDIVVAALVGTDVIDPDRFSVSSGDRPLVVASTTFLDDLVLRVAGDKVHRELIVGPGGDPHKYEPGARDKVLIERADLVLLNGWGLEPAIERLAASAEKPEGSVVEAAAGLSPHYEDDARTVPDPHMWLSIARAMKYVENIRDALSRIDPANAPLYHANANATQRELTVLDAHIRSILSEVPQSSRKLVTTHDAFRYFGNEYGIEVVDTLWGVTTEVEYTPEDKAQLVEFLRTNRVPAVFVETSVRQQDFVDAACDSGVKVGGSLFSDSLGLPGSGGHTYFTMMLTNAETLRAGMLGNGRDACEWLSEL